MSWRIEGRKTATSDWLRMPITWMSPNDDEVRAALVDIKAARRLVANANRGHSEDMYRLVVEP